MRLVSPAEGRFQRFGKWAEYDNWITNTAPAALRIGRSAAVATIVMGETIDFPVKVHNWSDVPQSGTVVLGTLPANFTSTHAFGPYGPIAPGADATVTLKLTSVRHDDPSGEPGSVERRRQHDELHPRAGLGDRRACRSCPRRRSTRRPRRRRWTASTAPGEYAGDLLDIGRIWEGGGNCAAAGFGTDCGTSGEVGGPTSTYARVAYRDDALFFFIRVRDEFQSYAVKPDECVAHWLADSVEILIDPRGRASENAMDTANTFKLGIFPFTNDPTNSNGNGVNGPCWSRDADNHQGFSTGPLAATVDDAPNAAGVQVYSSAKWVGTNDTGTEPRLRGRRLHARGEDPDGAPAGGDRPRPRVAEHHALRQRQHGGRGLDDAAPHRQQRRAWRGRRSAASSRTRTAGAARRCRATRRRPSRPTTYRTPNVSHPNLDGAASPQTIAQSARNGVPISGREPAPESRGLKINGATVSGTTVNLNVTAGAAGTARLFLYDVNPIDGNKSYTRVWNTSCDPATNPAPDYGLSACSAADGTTPPWAPDMMGGDPGLADVRRSRPGTSTLSLSAAPRRRGWRAARRCSCRS